MIVSVADAGEGTSSVGVGDGGMGVGVGRGTVGDGKVGRETVAVGEI